MAVPLVARRTLAAALISGVAYGVFLRHRPDYLGHYVAGLGATLMLFCLLWTRLRRALGWEAVGVAVTAIAIGFVTEQTIFRIVFFDPIDFCHQSLGACVACACVLDNKWDRSELPWLLGLAGLLVATGFGFAFA